MKQQIFWKLKLATVFSILLTIFFINEKMSASCVSSEKSNFRTDNFSEKNILSGTFDSDEDEIFALVNDERRKNNLKSLAWDNQLAEIARDYSRQMAEENFFDHFDPRGANVVVRAKRAKLKHWSKIGENLFSVENLKNFDAFAVKSWMESPTHRENILDADFNTAGIGIVESGDGEIFVTQVFIKR
jgi:uncharacterized protein YkwD